ncbi:hypothetical protein P4E94_02670 [Pontiellaceae bacterium B12219]|nr:hypothetical protein [Pontiellaceae bacterium B12219]
MANADVPLATRSMKELEQRLSTIDMELEQLASYSLRSGTGSNGFRTEANPTSDHPEWVEVDWGQEIPVEEIILIPTLLHDSKNGLQAEGFPLEFRVLAGTAQDKQGTLIADFTEKDKLLPRIAPVVIPCPKVRASWVRIEAGKLSPRGLDSYFALQLAELLVFSEGKNVALRSSVSYSGRPSLDANSGPWGAAYLTDGSVPYLMDAATGEKSIAFLGTVIEGKHPTITLDLGNARSISQISLHAIDQSDTIPQSNPNGFGIPQHFKIEGALQPDFSDASILVDAWCSDIYQTAPIMWWNTPAISTRYIRLTALEPSIFKGHRLGFAEIELFENGINHARGKPLTSKFLTITSDRSLSNMTDGLNYFGQILPLRDWLNQLALRHDLEAERPRIATELTRRYAAQKKHLHRMSWLTALFAAGIGFTILIDRNIRMRQLTRIKERFAADLHDELGANLHTIGMLGDLAREAIDSREELLELLERSRVFTERSGAAARYCTNMLEAKGLCEDLAEEMKRSSARLLGDLSYELSFQGEKILRQLKPRYRVDLFFFYKECLANIIRHSNATEVNARLIADPHQIELIISDNGFGLNGVTPPSLTRRARLLRARLWVESPPEGGSRIHLRLKVHRWILEKMKKIKL